MWWPLAAFCPLGCPHQQLLTLDDCAQDHLGLRPGGTLRSAEIPAPNSRATTPTASQPLRKPTSPPVAGSSPGGMAVDVPSAAPIDAVPTVVGVSPDISPPTPAGVPTAPGVPAPVPPGDSIPGVPSPMLTTPVAAVSVTTVSGVPLASGVPVPAPPAGTTPGVPSPIPVGVASPPAPVTSIVASGVPAPAPSAGMVAEVAWTPAGAVPVTVSSGFPPPTPPGGSSAAGVSLGPTDVALVPSVSTACWDVTVLVGLAPAADVLVRRGTVGVPRATAVDGGVVSSASGKAARAPTKRRPSKIARTRLFFFLISWSSNCSSNTRSPVAPSHAPAQSSFLR